MLECGCEGSCCRICEHAKHAGRPRLVRDNAADWGPPDLNKLKGAGNLDARNGDAGEPSMWYWQVYGTSWDRQRRSFNVATKAYRRLSATLEERRDATRGLGGALKSRRLKMSESAF